MVVRGHPGVLGSSLALSRTLVPLDGLDRLSECISVSSQHRHLTQGRGFSESVSTLALGVAVGLWEVPLKSCQQTAPTLCCRHNGHHLREHLLWARPSSQHPTRSNLANLLISPIR